MYEDMTAEAIQAELIAQAVEAGWSGAELALPSLLATPMSVELAKAYQAMAAMIPKFWVDETSGIFIEQAANTLGIYRKEGTFATASITLGGTAGVTVPTGTAFGTSDGLYFTLDTTVTLDSEGAGTGTITAEDIGDSYNIDAGELTVMRVNLSGLVTYVNTAATGGSDMESDAALYARLDLQRKTPGTSGNVYDYQQWALEVAGVGLAKVIPLASGAGTVSVLLVDEDGTPVSQDIADDCAAYIETVRPIGAEVTVSPATAVGVTVAATVTMDSTTTADTVEASLTALVELCQTWVDASGNYTLLYNRLLYLILGISGVTDFTALTVNGSAGNVSLTATQVPILEEVSVTNGAS